MLATLAAIVGAAITVTFLYVLIDEIRIHLEERDD
jgi:hypothetical protein